MNKKTTENKFNTNTGCVIIPTYNNDKTLRNVLERTLVFTSNIIVVNDGTTDTTADILKDFSQIIQLHLPENKGKGNALLKGFELAKKHNFKYAITIDSDGQHFPEDIPIFIDALESYPSDQLLLIGARNMSQESVPKKSSFGNKFSNFWYWIETGIKLQDTQSGYRLYPLEEINKLRLFTNKFEFEIEVIVKAAWNDVEVKNIPIRVLYDETERVSHFRPFKDFTRISILNTWLVIVTIFYIKPRNLYRKYKKKGIKRFFIENLLGSYDSPRKKAQSIALGIFIGLTPLWGFQTVIVIFLALFLKLNRTIAFAFSNVSLPPFIPFIIFASLYTGNFVLGQNNEYTLESIGENMDFLKHLKTYIIGSFSLAIITSISIGLLSYLILSLLNKKKYPTAHV